jgi:hypothetical protein
MMPRGFGTMSRLRLDMRIDGVHTRDMTNTQIDYTKPLSDADYLATYGFARRVRKTDAERTPAQRALRARITAHDAEKRAEAAKNAITKPSAEQYRRAGL